MKTLNRFLKLCAYILIYLWTLFSLYLFSMLIASTVIGVITGILSFTKGALPLLIVASSWKLILLIAIPLSLIFFAMVLYNIFKKDKKKDE